MRPLCAAVSNFVPAPLPALVATTFITGLTLLGQSSAVALPAGILHASICDSENVLAYTPGHLAGGDMLCPPPRDAAAQLADARNYLLETASPGFTMSKQGPEVAIERLHPEFAVRIAAAIREARASGLASAAIFSAYRPPAFGVGGFSDKFNSLHAYGLAVDMAGIGGPGSAEAIKWHEIAAKHGVICPYGPRNRAEWNHCQPTGLKIIVAANPLRHTINAEGPLSLEGMFEVGTSIIESADNADDTVGAIAKDFPVHRVSQRIAAGKTKRLLQKAVAARNWSGRKGKRNWHLASGRGGHKSARL